MSDTLHLSVSAHGGGMQSFLQDLAVRIVNKYGDADLEKSVELGLIKDMIDKGDVTYDQLYDELRFTSRGTIDSVIVAGLTKEQLHENEQLTVRKAMDACRRRDKAYLLAIAHAALRHYIIIEIGRRDNLANPSVQEQSTRKRWLARLLRWPWW